MSAPVEGPLFEYPIGVDVNLGCFGMLVPEPKRDHGDFGLGLQPGRDRFTSHPEWVSAMDVVCRSTIEMSRPSESRKCLPEDIGITRSTIGSLVGCIVW